MLKLTFCLRRLPSLSHVQFCDYWLSKHGPLVRHLQPALGMARYVQVHRLDDALDATLGGRMRTAKVITEMPSATCGNVVSSL